MSARTYIEPRFPDEPFFLVAVGEGWTLGPFNRKDFGTAQDGSKFYADGVVHPITLRVRAQHGNTLSANDGDIREQDYEIMPVSEAPPEWRGEAA